MRKMVKKRINRAKIQKAVRGLLKEYNRALIDYVCIKGSGKKEEKILDKVGRKMLRYLTAGAAFSEAFGLKL